MQLGERVLEGELMDAPDLAAPLHHHALQALRRVNWLSGTAGIVAQAILNRSTNRTVSITQCGNSPPTSKQRLRILDLACGGGDVSLAVARLLGKSGLDVEMQAWDRSPTAIAHARQLQESQQQRPGWPSNVQLSFANRDCFELDQPAGFDVVMSTLFLHHLQSEEAGRLLRKMYDAATGCMLIDDLRRTLLGYRLAQLGCRLLTRSPIVHVDGPLSVRAAFTEPEILQLSRQAELPQPSITRHWPQRFLACWQHRA